MLMADILLANTSPGYVSPNGAYGDRKVAKDILLKLDPGFSKVVSLYSKYMPNDESYTYQQNEFNQNRATAIDSDLSYSQGYTTAVSNSRASSQPIVGTDNRGASVISDLHQIEYVDDSQTSKKSVYRDKKSFTMTHRGDPSALESKPTYSTSSAEPTNSKPEVSKDGIKRRGEVESKQALNIDNSIPGANESLKPGFREINQYSAKYGNTTSEKQPDNRSHLQASSKGQKSLSSDSKIPQKERALADSPQSGTPKVDMSKKSAVKTVSPVDRTQRPTLLSISEDPRTYQKESIPKSKRQKPNESLKGTTAVSSVRDQMEQSGSERFISDSNKNRSTPQRKGARSQPSSPNPSSMASQKTPGDDGTFTNLTERPGHFMSPDPSADRDLDNASPTTLEFCNRHRVHYCLFVYFSSATVDEDLMPFRRKMFMDKLSTINNPEVIQEILATKCGRDAYTDRRVRAIERKSRTEIHLSDLDPDSAFIKGLPRRRLTIGGSNFAQVSCALALFEALLPNVTRSAIFPYRLPSGSSTRYSAGDRISSTYNWESGRSDGTVYLTKQLDDRGGWKSFIPSARDEATI